MEGKEVRFGNAMTALFATVTTDASCGAVIGMHDSFTPIGGLVPLFNIQTDEVIFGGVGAGFYSMLIYAVVAVFIGVGVFPRYRHIQAAVAMLRNRHVNFNFRLILLKEFGKLRRRRRGCRT